MIRALILLLLLTSAAHSADCPSDKPIKRKTTWLPTTITCTALACSPKLVCATHSDRCWYQAVDCNRCSPEPQEIEICLSQEELDKSR